ncbi:MAG TPA: MBL fold metallo-hydrolase [Synergistales bacterium]|nr:MBL fold metallo-hydrolase [Synergistales bacterium]
MDRTWKKNISIIATETLGVRGLCCVVRAGDRRVLIDPGIALGYYREGLLPHPVQIAVGSIIRERIIREVKAATDIVISHFHGDHMPLVDPNPYQLGVDGLRECLNTRKVWVKEFSRETGKRLERASGLADLVDIIPVSAEKQRDGIMAFHGHLDHGEEGSFLGQVLITSIDLDGHLFCHASDLQLLSTIMVEKLLEYSPSIVMVSGPPLYLEDFMETRKAQAWYNAALLAENVDILILDHHLFRSRKGLEWFERLRETTGREIFSAAGLEDMEPHLLEAMRAELYDRIPVTSDWHRQYIMKKEDPFQYLARARKMFSWFGY